MTCKKPSILTILALTCLIMSMLFVRTAEAINIGIDLVGLTINIIDGDTFDIKVTNLQYMSGGNQ